MKTSPLCSAGLLTIALCANTSAYSQALTPFSTGTRNYVYIGKAGFNASTASNRLFTVNSPSMGVTTGNGLVSGSGTPITYVPNSTTAQGLNGAGISNVDGYLYAVDYLYSGPSSASARLYRVGSNALAEQVGVVLPPTSADAGRAIQYAFINASCGLIDNNKGQYWFTAYTLTDLMPPLNAGKMNFFLGKIPELDSLSAGTNAITPIYYAIDISDSILQTGYTNFITSAAALVLGGYPFTNARGGWQDMDLNPTDHKFYSYLSVPSAAPPLTQPYPQPALNGHLVRIDTLKNDPNYWGRVVVLNQTPNTVPDEEEDGAWFDESGNFYSLYTNGDYAQINLTNGTLGPQLPSGLPLLNGQTRGDIAANTPVNQLPVKLLSFTGKASPENILLEWELVDWESLMQLQVERSLDGNRFECVATIKQDASQQAYRGPLSPAGDRYYRLRMQAKNGLVSFSPVLNLNSSKKNALVSVYPNPCSQLLSVRTTANQVWLTAHYLNGQKVLSGSYPGSTTLSIADLPAGLYLLEATDEATGAKLISQLIQKQ